VTASAAVIAVLNEQIKTMEAKVGSPFRRHPDAGTYLSQPGIGVITGARMLGEFGDAPGRYADAKARRNYAGTSPLTIASGKKKTVHARFIHNDHLVAAMHDQAFTAISASPGARAY
jgi:transposase